MNGREFESVETLLRVSKKIDILSDWTGRIFSFLLIPLTLLVVYEVITRQLGAPTIWTFETCIFFYGAHFMLTASYGLLHKSHVCIDLISTKFSKRKDAIVSIICYILMYFPFVIIVTYYGYDFAASAWEQLETSWSAWGPPIYPIKTVIPLTGLMLLLQGISEVIKYMRVLTETKEVRS